MIEFTIGRYGQCWLSSLIVYCFATIRLYWELFIDDWKMCEYVYIFNAFQSSQKGAIECQCWMDLFIEIWFSSKWIIFWKTFTVQYEMKHFVGFLPHENWWMSHKWICVHIEDQKREFSWNVIAAVQKFRKKIIYRTNISIFGQVNKLKMRNVCSFCCNLSFNCTIEPKNRYKMWLSFIAFCFIFHA